MDKRRESSQTRRIRRTKVDWFGIIMMFVLLVCSLAIFARLMATKMLTTTNLVLVMAALLVVNGLHIFVQLPLRRNKLGKLICGVLAVLLSAGMIYGTVAAGGDRHEGGRGHGYGRYQGLPLRHPGEPRYK